MRAMLASSKMCSVPGRPSAAPVIVTGTVGWGALLAVVDLPAALENIGEQMAKFDVAIAVHGETGVVCGCVRQRDGT